MTFVVPVGPQHPMLKEPEFFRFEVKGEEIVGVDIRLGYAHRGIEEALSRRSYKHNVYLCERICGICNVVHSTTYCQTVEQLAGVEPPERAKYIRAILMELERIHSHLLWLGVAAHQIGFNTLFMLAWRDREYVMDLRELISGGRVHSAMNTIGGVRRDVRSEHVPTMLRGLDKLEQSARYYTDLWGSDRTILARCTNVGVLSKDDAIKFCAVGPLARASDVKVDIRKDDPYGAYGALSFNVITEQEGDVWAKGMVRLREILESIKIVRQALKELPSGPVRTPVELKIPPNETVERTEAPRGELIYYIRSNGTDTPERVRVRTPTYGNFASMKSMFAGGTVAEIPIVMWSIDPCFGCNDRITLVDSHTGKARVVSFDELRRWKK
ncbi:MAG: nickel-dependent hydrogenase large subunit [Candidatus Hodarchaeaceae archaeon]|nr:nickel-dependent hydrogenase large subunit [Candidatus Hodarchaeaceae archaeon]